jgi:hypothetical protein
MLVPSALIVQLAIAAVRAQMIPTMKSMSKSLDNLGNGNELSSRKLLDMLRTDHKKAPMSPANTLDSESQGSPSDVAYASEEIPVSGVLTLKEVNGRMQYSLTFS